MHDSKCVVLTDSLMIKGVSFVIHLMQYIWMKTSRKGTIMRISSSRPGVNIIPQERSSWTPKVLKNESTAVKEPDRASVAK